MKAAELGNKLLYWRMAYWKVGVGIAILSMGTIMAGLPSQDWISPQNLKIVLFAMGIFQTVLKGVDMFFDQTMGLLRAGVEHPAPETPTPSQTTQ
jgi:hypothetical protein